MTVLKLGIPVIRYVGQSTDTKPTTVVSSGAASPIPIGSTFLEYDTGQLYINYDGTNWKVKDIISIKTLTHTEASVGTGSTATLSANTSRVYALFQNDSDEVIYIFLGATAVMNKGIRLAATGGSYEIDSTNLYKGVVKSICTTGTKNLLVTEGV